MRQHFQVELHSITACQRLVEMAGFGKPGLRDLVAHASPPAMAVLLREWTYLLVAGGAGYQLTKKDFPPMSGRATLAYFAAVLVLLGAVLYLVPGNGFDLK